jgi:hypothetical protein
MALIAGPRALPECLVHLAPRHSRGIAYFIYPPIHPALRRSVHIFPAQKLNSLENILNYLRQFQNVRFWNCNFEKRGFVRL